MGANLPGQSSMLCGQAIQVASCGSHSAGMRQASAAGDGTSALPFLVEQPFDRRDGLLHTVEVRVDAQRSAEAPQGRAQLLQLHEALTQTAGRAEMARIESQRPLAVRHRPAVDAAAELENAALVVG